MRADKLAKDPAHVARVRAGEVYEANRRAALTPAERVREDLVDKGHWADDWSDRAERLTPEAMAERRGATCKERPKDSRVNRKETKPGSGAHDERVRFVPWCDRKKD